MVYCVCYDLKSPTRNYGPLVEAIKSYNTWWHHLDSTWFIVTDDNATTIRNRLQASIDSADELLVFPVGSDWAGVGFETKAYDWLRKHWN